MTGTQPGLVVAGFGRHVLVETESGQRLICHPRGKKSQVVVGDHIRWLPSQDEGTVEKIEERSNLLYRQDELRTKSFAANLDLVLILIAAEPEFSESQLTRALIAAEAEQIKEQMGVFLRDTLQLELSPEKTLITHATTQAAQFLGYEVVVHHCDTKHDRRGRRQLNRNPGLRLPTEVVEKRCSLL